MEGFKESNNDVLQAEKIDWQAVKTDTELKTKLEQLVDDVRTSVNSIGKNREEIKNEIKNHLKEAGFKYAIAVDILDSTDGSGPNIECRTVSPISSEIIEF